MASSESFYPQGRHGSFSESPPDEESCSRTTLQLDLTNSSEGKIVIMMRTSRHTMCYLILIIVAPSSPDIQTKRGSALLGDSLNLTNCIVGKGIPQGSTALFCEHHFRRYHFPQTKTNNLLQR
jgi:hypothetical protein